MFAHCRELDASTLKATLVDLWLIDSGCTHDLVGKRTVRSLHRHMCVSGQPVSFNTANGPAKADMLVPLRSRDLEQDIMAYALDDTPAVLTMGRRCME